MMVAVSPRLEIMTVPTGQIASCVVDMHACCLLPIAARLPVVRILHPCTLQEVS